MARGLYPDDPEPPARTGRGFTVNPEDRSYRASGVDDDDEDQPARRSFMRPILACLVALLCAGALYFVYSKGKEAGAGPGGVPLIRADQGSSKSKPDQPGGDAVPDQDKSVYNMNQPGAGVERLLPAPEQPLPRPSGPPSTPVIQPADAPLPTQEVGVAAQPKEAPPTPVTPASSPAAPSMLSAPEGTKSVPGVVVPPPPEAKPAAAVAPAQKPTVAPAAKPVPQVAAAPAAGGSFRIQIAATKDDASAHKEWERLQKAHADLLGTLSPTMVKADLGDKGVFYRIQAGPIADHAQADKLCTQLKAFSIGCLVVKAQ